MTEFRPGRMQVIPPVIKSLIIVNVLVFIIQKVYENSGQSTIENLFALHDVQSSFFRPHQIITYMFLHGSIPHIFLNMLALWMFGSLLENFWGAKRFLNFYLVCGIGAALLHLFVLHREMIPIYEELHQASAEQQQEVINNPNFIANSATLGASGAVFGCLAAFGYLFPNSLIYVYFMIPIKAKWFVLIYGIIELASGINNSAGDNVAHWAHLGGGLVGLLLVLYWRKHDRRNFY